MRLGPGGSSQRPSAHDPVEDAGAGGPERRPAVRAEEGPPATARSQRGGTATFTSPVWAPPDHVGCPGRGRRPLGRPHGCRARGADRIGRAGGRRPGSGLRVGDEAPGSRLDTRPGATERASRAPARCRASSARTGSMGKGRIARDDQSRNASATSRIGRGQLADVVGAVEAMKGGVFA